MLEWTQESFKEIYERNSDMVYRLCVMYLKSDCDAKDGIQEIFIKLWEKKPNFLNSNHEKAWLIQTTKHYCLDVLKSSWVKKRVDIDDFKEKLANEPATESEQWKLLEKVMLLPYKFREVIYLYYYEEYSVREISELLHRKESTIQSQLASGRKKLRKVLETNEFVKREVLDDGKEYV